MRRLLSADGIVLAESAVLLLLVRLALVVFPFRTVLNFVNRAAASSAVRKRVPRPTERVVWAVVKASGYIPGAGHCLTQALVAKTLLGNQGRAVDVRIGVAKDEGGQLIAHAWLEADGKPIFGVTDSQLDRYSRLPQFDGV
jgi:hypothetical protein